MTSNYQHLAYVQCLVSDRETATFVGLSNYFTNAEHLICRRHMDDLRRKLTTLGISDTEKKFLLTTNSKRGLARKESV